MNRVRAAAAEAVRTITTSEVSALAGRVLLGVVLLSIWNAGLGGALWDYVQDREVFVRLVAAVGTVLLAVSVGLRVLSVVPGASRCFAGASRCFPVPVDTGVAVAVAGGAWSSEWQRRARHEAAHTVAALALGATVHSVDIRTRSNSTGGVTETIVPDLSYGDRQWLRLVISVAPYTADVDAHRELSTAGTELDLVDARGRALTLLALDHHPKGVDADLSSDGLLVAAIARARDILDAHRNELDAITAALLEHTALDAAALDELWPHHLAPATDAGGVRVTVHHTQGEDR
ncbi:hypothetical protein [Gordonia sp. 'Campus']|uniref:hypothetical protein n=1 Tax=Gordonia sp. 'Campus' TaxID=2915824 RepID=UPI001EE4AC64|nr:hypothetical protein [Gordonia sp. 'Campus']